MPMLRSLVGGATAVVLGLLPRRRWQAFPALSIERLAWLSGLATLLAGVALGAAGFFDYLPRIASAANDLTFALAERQLSGQLPGTDEVSTALPVGLSALSFLGFLLFTPAGLAASYLAVTGLLRAVSASVEDPLGDPILTGLDHAIAGGWRRWRDSATRKAREELEGPEMPDRLMPAAWAGVADAEFVVVSSRRKPGWEAGAAIATDAQWYKLGTPFDLSLPDGLRTIYPLGPFAMGDVARRTVEYELPRLERPARPARPERG